MPRSILTKSAVAVVAVVLALFTAVDPVWVEWLAHVDPDRGSGILEWVIVVAFALAAVIAGSAAGSDFRRWRAARA